MAVCIMDQKPYISLDLVIHRFAGFARLAKSAHYLNKRPMGLEVLLMACHKRSSNYGFLLKTESSYLKWLLTNSQMCTM